MGAGRPTLQSLSYVPMDVYFDRNPKFVRIIIEFGARGAFIALEVLFAIYRSSAGYYMQCTEDVFFSVAHDSNCAPNLVKEVVAGMARCGLLDEKMYKKFNVLTSVGIQKRWLLAMKRRKEINTSEYWLLDIVDNNSNNACNNSDETEECMQESTNQIKSNQIKVNEEIRTASSIKRFGDRHVQLEDVLSLYQVYYGKRDFAKINKLCEKYGNQCVYEAIDKAGDRVKASPYGYIEQILYVDEECKKGM